MSGDAHAAHGHDKKADKGGPSTMLLVIGALILFLGPTMTKCGSSKDHDSRAPEGARGRGVNGAVDYVLAPGHILRKLHPEELLRKQVLFVDGVHQEDKDGTPILSVRVPLGLEPVKIWVNGASGWSINPDIFEYRGVNETRWRRSGVARDRPSAVFPEFEIRLAEGQEFDPLDPPRVTIVVHTQ